VDKKVFNGIRQCDVSQYARYSMCIREILTAAENYKFADNHAAKNMLGASFWRINRFHKGYLLYTPLNPDNENSQTANYITTKSAKITPFINCVQMRCIQ